MAFARSAFANDAFQMDGDLTVASPVFQPPAWLWPEAVMTYGLPSAVWDISVADLQQPARVNETETVLIRASSGKGIKANYQ